MFCKWCGNNIQLTDRKCPACGRETPPMSDCGGLYNLKHANTGPVKEKVIVKEVPYCAAVEKLDVKYLKERKAAKKHHTITMLCYFAILFAVVCSVLLTLRLNNRLRELEKQIDNIRIEIPTYPTEANLIDPTESQLDDLPVESTRNNFKIDTTVVNVDSKEISNAYDFGDYAESVKVTTAATESEKGREFALSFVLDEDALVALDLIFAQEETDALSVGVKCRSELPLFDNEDFTYAWQYCTGSGDWLSLDQKLVTENNGYYGLFFDEYLWNTVDWSEYPRELRCIIAVENEDGDMMVITVDGFPVYQDAQFG